QRRFSPDVEAFEEREIVLDVPWAIVCVPAHIAHCGSIDEGACAALGAADGLREGRWIEPRMGRSNAARGVVSTHKIGHLLLARGIDAVESARGDIEGQ